MADVAAPTPKAKTASKPKKPATHPKYSEMIAAALQTLKNRGGSSRAAILKYISANYNLGGNAAAVNAHLKMALKNGVKNGSLKQAKGVGAAGSFKLGEVKKVAAPKKAKKPKAVKPKKAKTPKKATKKPTAKKPAAKTPKKATKSPKKAKAAAKPKKATGAKPKKAAAATKPKKATKSPKKAKATKK